MGSIAVGISALWPLRPAGTTLLQVKLNRGLEFPPLDDVLMDMKLTPEVLELPAPHYFLEDRQKVPLSICWQNA